MNWRANFTRTGSGWYVFYDATLGITYVMDETLVKHIDSLSRRNQVATLVDLFARAGEAIGKNSLVSTYGI